MNSRYTENVLYDFKEYFFSFIFMYIDVYLLFFDVRPF